MLLATGTDDIEPNLPDLPDAIRRGLVRYCPICDGYEAKDKRIAVIGYGDRGLGEAVFVARTYSRDVTLLTLGQGMALDARQREQVERHGIMVVHEPVLGLDIGDGRITVLRTAGRRGAPFRGALFGPGFDDPLRTRPRHGCPP